VLKEEDLRAEKASIYLNASRIDDAEKFCKTIVANPVSKTEKQKAEKILAGIYEKKGRVDEALQLYIDIVPFEHDDSVKMSLARLYDKKGDVSNALRYVSLLKDKGLRSAEIEKRLRHLIAAGDAKAVEYLLKFAVSIDKDSPFLITAARYLNAKGKKREGELMLKRAETGVERGEAALSLGQIFFDEGKYSEARKSITPLLLENRYFIKASFMMADIMIKEGDIRGAIACLEKAGKYSKDSRITSRLADLYFETGDRAAAFKYYKAASERGDANASLKAADLLFLSGKASQARTYYHRALSLKLSDEKSLQWAYYQYGKMTGNKGYLKKASNNGGLVGEAAGILAGETQ
jgi:tetratricopeptide (TPR) repeat protein